ncbi:unnamed protein product, partial [Candidula unifasciata]
NVHRLFIHPSAIPDSPAKWGWRTKVVATHIIVAVGLIANSLTFAVMKSPRLRYKSYSHYLKTYILRLSICFHLSSPKQLFVFAEAVCNLMSSWLIAVMAMERLCVVCMPFRRNMWCQQRGAVIIIFTLFSFLACTQMFVMVENHNNHCVGSPDHDYIYIPLHIYVYQFALLFITPVIVVVICNTGVLIQIFSRKHNKTTRMLVAISFTYLVTTLPLIILTITVYLLHQNFGTLSADTFLKILPWMHFLQAVTNLNYASNFFIYIVSGQKFRMELRRMFCNVSGNSFGAGSTRTRDEILMNSY